MKTKFRFMAAKFVALAISTSAFADNPTSSGTGFAVTSDGWIMTNAHVVEKCSRIEIKGKGAAFDPRIDATNDLALVKVSVGLPLKPLTFRRTPTRLGEDIVSIGYPLADLLSDSVKITTGNVNALAGLKNDTRYIQISTPIQPGNSGGPVVDRDGFLLGVTSATFSKQAADEIGITAQNINFAIRGSVGDLFMQSQNIQSHSGDKVPAQPVMTTADLADIIAPSVFQILCYGSPVQQSSVQTQDTVTNIPRATANVPLLDASGYDAIGFDYGTLKNVSYQDCRTACETDRQCKAITYNAKHRFCFLKDNVVALIRNSDAMAAYSSAKAADVIVSDFTSYSGVDIPGGDYKRLTRTNYLECFVACVGDNACRAFAYVAKKNECWLKDTLGRPKATKGVDLGVK
ncbi:trypsin-like peptidase domain-containing protein [Ensifer sp. ENS07]|uniref:trypsin-like peptidase domain-containing protein n=1 Tax=unclassified Ensifer TaxID=2633371 RepID=UPI00177BB176|nr:MULTISPECIES: trypsin-like peptidase domain-containing protein [unclassified Ensifer]MBD9508009.1 trypsin-like peptidase domain-containing protein [Ensifer sp. ENS10]MBD9637495.1 trypsin-like peptidase domain-containing protein [Ensifer sp. ENS07]